MNQLSQNHIPVKHCLRALQRGCTLRMIEKRKTSKDTLPKRGVSEPLFLWFFLNLFRYRYSIFLVEDCADEKQRLWRLSEIYLGMRSLVRFPLPIRLGGGNAKGPKLCQGTSRSSPSSLAYNKLAVLVVALSNPALPMATQCYCNIAGSGCSQLRASREFWEIRQRKAQHFRSAQDVGSAARFTTRRAYNSDRDWREPTTRHPHPRVFTKLVGWA